MVTPGALASPQGRGCTGIFPVSGRCHAGSCPPSRPLGASLRAHEGSKGRLLRGVTGFPRGPCRKNRGFGLVLSSPVYLRLVLGRASVSARASHLFLPALYWHLCVCVCGLVWSPMRQKRDSVVARHVQIDAAGDGYLARGELLPPMTAGCRGGSYRAGRLEIERQIPRR